MFHPAFVREKTIDSGGLSCYIVDIPGAARVSAVAAMRRGKVCRGCLFREGKSAVTLEASVDTRESLFPVRDHWVSGDAEVKETAFCVPCGMLSITQINDKEP